MRSLSIERASVFILFILLFAIAFRPPVDTDTWWHLRSGDYMLSNGLIHGDPFSYTNQGGTWINHSWGAQFLMLGFWRIGGIFGLALYTALLATGGMLLLYGISAGNNYLRGFILVLGAATAAVFWSARPQMLSFFFSCLVLFIVYHYKRTGKDWLWGIVPLMWLWANVHAGWSIGYLFLFAFLAGEFVNLLFGLPSIGWQGWRKLLLVTVVSVPFLALSPYFLDNILVPPRTVNIEGLRNFIQEWQSPNFQGRETWPFIALLILLLLGFWASRLKFDWSSFFLLSGTLFLALLYSRNIAVFAVVTTPILTHHLDNALTERGYILRSRRTTPPLVASVNLLLIVVALLGTALYGFAALNPKSVAEAQAKILPLDAVEYLRENPAPREIYNSYNWGGYLMFSLPEYLVFIDGRTDLYANFLSTYSSIAFALDGWEAELDNYGVNTILIEKNSLLDHALQDSSNWHLVYEDELAVIWQRTNNE